MSFWRFSVSETGQKAGEMLIVVKAREVKMVYFFVVIFCFIKDKLLGFCCFP